VADLAGAGILDDLDARGLVHDHTDRTALAESLSNGPVTLYCGFDPTADSLHLGNLVPLALLRRFQLAGHRPLVLAGGATGMIGDPGGRSEERNLLDRDTLEANTVAVSRQLAQFLDFDDPVTGAKLVDNREWTEPMGVLDFLRDVGKHMTVNTMLARDSVKSRLDRENGISFTEFSYMLLQANDYLVLHERYGCSLQVAGSDQWGNITAGIDLIRRRVGASVGGLTVPLITRTDGTKFGKSVGGAVWLDPNQTSPYEMFQFLFNVGDDDVAQLLPRLTLLEVEVCRAILERHAAAPHQRHAQRELARAVVAMIHGDAVISDIEAAQSLLFGRSGDQVPPAAYELLAKELGTTEVHRSDIEAGVDIVGLLVQSGLGASKGEVRRNLSGYRINGEAVGERATVGVDDCRAGRYLLLQRGKASHHLVVVAH